MCDAVGKQRDCLLALNRRYVVFLGADLLAWLVLAIGGAMAAGNLAAVVSPPEKKISDDDLDQAPLIRSLVFVVVGLLASIWAIASLVSG